MSPFEDLSGLSLNERDVSSPVITMYLQADLTYVWFEKLLSHSSQYSEIIS